MLEVIEFLKAKNIEKTRFYQQLKCTVDEARVLQYLSKEFINGRDILKGYDVKSIRKGVDIFIYLNAKEV